MEKDLGLMIVYGVLTVLAIKLGHAQGRGDKSDAKKAAIYLALFCAGVISGILYML